MITGSHLDTQPSGGKFDGIYGVLGGLEVLHTLHENNITTLHPLEVVVWTNEEGVRFGPPLTGSSVFAGAVTLEEAHASTTVDGTTVREDLENTGFLGEERPGTRALDSFFEAHIEQGPVLDAESIHIGVVTQIVGIRWVEIEVVGHDAHAGTTPMAYRRDALNGASRIMVQLDDYVRSLDPLARLTIGKITVKPNSGATVPGLATFNCDLRHPDSAVLDQMEAEIRRVAEEVAVAQNLELSVRTLLNKPPLPFSPDIISSVRNAAEELQLTHKDMLSGAGHDAMNLAHSVPTGMIFVPCYRGISHNEAESAEPEDLAAGAAVLLRAMLSRARAQ